MTLIRKPVGHENECSSRKQRSIFFYRNGLLFLGYCTVCKWTMEAVLWLLLCFFFFTVGPSDWIALLFYYMTKRNNTIAAEAALWTMAKARTIIGFICIHLICSHAISYCLLHFIITPRKSIKGNHFIPFFLRISMENDVINVLTERRSTNYNNKN